MEKIEIQHYENNPRQITKNQFARLQETMKEFGDLSGIVLNIKTIAENGKTKEVAELIGGNQRSEAGQFINRQPIITEEFFPALDDGTIAVGYFELDGKRFNCRFVRWNEEKALRANLIANVGGGNWDMDILSNISEDILLSSGFDKDIQKQFQDNASGVLELLQGMEIPEFQEYDETIADGIEVCKCPACGHEHATKK